IGIRMALGADRGAVVRMVIRQGMMPALVGLVAGGALALLAMRGLSALLYGVSSADPITYIANAALIVVVALVASWLPARGAARLDPVNAIRTG
ncbi:MAG TPA: FtsX-like permease family protein, partial [Gemmatimonadaceae bacterium]|nr:FtsX-like permease family protein [Gemmatimonadaceae bacterium]